MKCPNCSSEVPENNSYCNKCGASLYGPRSINLNDIGQGENVAQSNNIQSITGININDLNDVGTNYKPVQQINNSLNNQKKTKKIKSKNNSANLGTILMLIVIVILLGLSIFLFSQNKKLKNLGKCENKPTSCPEVDKCIEGIYGLTSKYNFYLPSEWYYSQTVNETIITNGETSVLLFDIKNGLIDKITADTLVGEYKKQGFENAAIEESTLNHKKIMYIKFQSNGKYLVDFYYQYNSENIIYGQISANSDNVLTEEIKNIISSAKLHERGNDITVGKANVNYEEIFKIIK